MSLANQTSDLHAWTPAHASMNSQRMSEDQFEAWVLAGEGIRADWVNGVVQMMLPVSIEHAELNGWLMRLLGNFVEEKNLGGMVVFDYMIRLCGGKMRRVPDIHYVTEARRSLMQRTDLDGPPDLAVEIVSDDSQSRDWREKYHEYEAAGVREYWIVDPFSQRIEANALGPDGKYARIEEVEGRLPSAVLPGFHLRNEWLWSNPRPTVRSLLGELGDVAGRNKPPYPRRGVVNFRP